MRRHTSDRVLQSSIAINQKKNNSIVSNAMKIMNNALIERLRDREKTIVEQSEEIAELKTLVEQRDEEILRLKANEPIEKLVNEYIEAEIAESEEQELAREESRKTGLNALILKNNNP